MKSAVFGPSCCHGRDKLNVAACSFCCWVAQRHYGSFLMPNFLWQFWGAIRERPVNEAELEKNQRFWSFWHSISDAVNIWPRLLWTTSRKSHTKQYNLLVTKGRWCVTAIVYVWVEGRGRRVRSTSFNDVEWLSCTIISLFTLYIISFGAAVYTWVKIDSYCLQHRDCQTSVNVNERG